MFTCFIKYIIDPDKMEEFEKYARLWISLIVKYGGIHHGYFLSEINSDNLPKTTFSFPNIGKEGPNNIAVALFSFPDLNTYESYKKNVTKDEKCHTATLIFNKTNCFKSYERNFFKPIFK